MAFTPVTSFVSWIRRIEKSGDAWAAKRLSPEEYREAMALDAELKRNFGRWLCYYGTIAGTVTVVLYLLSTLGFVRSLAIANVMVIAVLLSFISVWYGYRRYTGPRARRTFTYFAMALLLGGAVGALMATLDGGRPIASLFTPEKLLRTFGAVLAVGAGLAAIYGGIAFLRGRDVQQRMALLEGEAERERLARQSVQAELKLLQAQVEPHFLFNTLANVRYLVQTGSPDALAMLDHLIHYLRTALPEIRSEGSTLGREAELARAYLEIMRLRMGGALEVAIDVPEDLARTPFPPLMVMTLVENAIKHGVAPMGRGRIAIRARSTEGRLRVEVADDGRGLAEPIGRGVGLANVRERLTALFGPEARLELEGAEAGGTVAAIEVPDR
ncbi:MAG TPA: histidine kinase [Usitatibacter sp.]|nr:histidine kinase [Usitatibacter sp.]